MSPSIFSAIFGTFRRWFARSTTPDDLYTADRMRYILERERGRADRTGTPLSVISFLVADSPIQSHGASWLVKILRARLRVLDEIGWLDDRRICAVLPGTPTQGARKVIADVYRNFPPEIVPPRCTVYTYPDETCNEGHDSSSLEMPVAASLRSLLVQPLPVWKRSLDICGALIGLLVFSPLFAAIAGAIKITASGPVLFRQQRSGHGGRPFFIYKFRTMIADAEYRKAELLERNERDGPAFKVKDDPRVTTLGWMLRTTSLDELPQLWNILKGDMSLVGPRPLPCHESDGCIGWQRQRLDVTPGLTCIWQVKGRGGVSFADWVRMDVRYIRSCTLWQDVKLLLLTVPAVVLRRGAH